MATISLFTVREYQCEDGNNDDVLLMLMLTVIADARKVNIKEKTCNLEQLYKRNINYINYNCL